MRIRGALSADFVEVGHSLPDAESISLKFAFQPQDFQGKTCAVITAQFSVFQRFESKFYKFTGIMLTVGFKQMVNKSEFSNTHFRGKKFIK